MSFWKKLFGKSQLFTKSIEPFVPFETRVEDVISNTRYIHRPLLYVLQHRLLPDLLSLDEDGWAYFFLAGTSTQGLNDLVNMAAAICESSGLWPQGITNLENFPIYIQKTMSQVSVFLVEDDDWDIRVISMPKPIATSEAYWIALCIPHQRSEDSGRYYTLESSVAKGAVAFCEWTKAGEHINYGIGPLMTVNDFASRIKVMLRV